MNKPIRQHYVPQVYLKFFSQQRDKIWEINVADKNREKLYRANIRDIAFEKNFYTIESLGAKKYAWEQYYAEEIEPLIGKTFTSLIQVCTNIFTKDRQVVINNELRAKLSIIIITQLLRTPKARSQQYEISSNIFPTVIKNAKKIFYPYISLAQKSRLNRLRLNDIFKEIDMQAITDPNRISQFSQVIYDRYWIVYRNNNHQANPFVTSDHPVIQYNLSAASTSLKDNGIGNPQTIIHYPINSQLILAIYPKFPVSLTMKNA